MIGRHDWEYMFDNQLRKCKRCMRTEKFTHYTYKGSMMYESDWEKCSEEEFKAMVKVYEEKLRLEERSRKVEEINRSINNCFYNIRNLEFTSYTVESLLHYIKQLPRQIYYVRFNDKYNEVDFGEFKYRFKCYCYFDRARRAWYE
jgi:hypothetical protein